MARYLALMRIRFSATQRVQPGEVVEIDNAAQAASLLAAGAIREAAPQPGQPPAPPAPVAAQAAPAGAQPRKRGRPSKASAAQAQAD